MKNDEEKKGKSNLERKMETPEGSVVDPDEKTEWEKFLEENPEYK